jgi:DNA-binding response OmpR family regulator
MGEIPHGQSPSFARIISRLILAAMRNNGMPTGRSASTPTPDRAASPNRILVVDDDICIRDISAQILASSGYQVDTVEDGAAAWDALHASSYDLLITDNNMPKVSGIDLVKRLRSERMALPVIMASGFPAEMLERIPSLRLDATLPKPFTGDELLGTVKRVLQACSHP